MKIPFCPELQGIMGTIFLCGKIPYRKTGIQAITFPSGIQNKIELPPF